MNILVLGTFDGVHLGHQHLLEYALGKGNVIACSFTLPPATVKGQAKALSTAEEKTSLLKKYGVNEKSTVINRRKLTASTLPGKDRRRNFSR